MLTTDEATCEAAITALTEYAEEHLVSAEREFVCVRALGENGCRASIARRRNPCMLVTGESPFIGTRFFTQDSDGREFRVVVIGKERGGDEPNITIARRSEIIRGYVSRHEETKHLQGTFLALRLLLGGKSTASQRPEVAVNGLATHVVECFALVNSLACSAKPNLNTRKSYPSSTMKSHCSNHLVGMLDAVRPTVLIVQGDVAHEVLAKELPTPAKPENRAFAMKAAGRELVFCSFSHPSPPGAQPWYATHLPYFRDVVRPEILRARDLLLAMS